MYHASSRRFSRWSSIAWKLTVFVGVVVVLNGAALIGVTYSGHQGDSRGSDFQTARYGGHAPAGDAGDHAERA